MRGVDDARAHAARVGPAGYARGIRTAARRTSRNSRHAGGDGAAGEARAAVAAGRRQSDPAADQPARGHREPSTGSTAQPLGGAARAGRRALSRTWRRVLRIAQHQPDHPKRRTGAARHSADAGRRRDRSRHAPTRTRPPPPSRTSLDYVPGVFAQPKWGDDTRLSIRGSGLSRNFHLRGVQLYMDGIPINTADGYGDFQEIDPTAYRYVEVYKGANALRFGANSLGGAINFVTPTRPRCQSVRGRASMSAASASRAGRRAPAAYQRPLRTTSSPPRRRRRRLPRPQLGRGRRAATPTVGYRFSPDVETRFYLNANDVRQRIPGERDEGHRAEHRRRPPRPATCTTTGNATSTRCASPTRRRCGSARPPSRSARSASTVT